MYYGGEPATWTKVPDLPDDAKYEAMAAPAAVTGKMPWDSSTNGLQKCIPCLSSWLHLATPGYTLQHCCDDQIIKP